MIHVSFEQIILDGLLLTIYFVIGMFTGKISNSEK